MRIHPPARQSVRMGDADDTIGRVPALTLTWGGGALAFASLFPLLSNVGYLLPSVDLSWVYANHPVVGALSAIALIAGCIVLAAGLRGEPGIAGASIVGRVALIVFGLSHTLSTGYFAWRAPGSDADAALLVLWSVLIWGSTLLALAALGVAAIVVLRAGVIRGAARWALPALAVLTVVALLASMIPSLAFIPVWMGALIASEVAQLATGVLFVVEGQRARSGDGLRAASA